MAAGKSARRRCFSSGSRCRALQCGDYL